MGKKLKERAPKAGAPQRQSNFELLRILMMLFIIAHHFVVHGHIDFHSDLTITNYLWLRFLESGGKIGVDVFVMISGYFLINSTKFKPSRSLKLWLQLLFYSVGLFWFNVCIGEVSLSADESLPYTIAYTFMPVINNTWWFASTYFILYLISPFLNMVMRNCTQKQIKLILIAVFIIWSVIPTLFNGNQSNDLLFFAFLYMLGGYYRKYGDSIKIPAWAYALMFILIEAVLVVWATYIDKNDMFNSVWSQLIKSPYSSQHVLTLAASVFVFRFFSKIKIPYSKIINWIASLSFAVYLMHDSPYIRELLWGKVLRVSESVNDEHFILYSMGIIISVYAFFSVFEILRQLLVENCYKKALTKIDDKIYKKDKKQ